MIPVLSISTYKIELVEPRPPPIVLLLLRENKLARLPSGNNFTFIQKEMVNSVKF